jgi:hypothetical protein
MTSNHICLFHDGSSLCDLSSSNANKIHDPLPPHTKKASKNNSLLHDITYLSNPSKLHESSPLHTEGVFSVSSLPHDEPDFPDAAINRLLLSFFFCSVTLPFLFLVFDEIGLSYVVD